MTRSAQWLPRRSALSATVASTLASCLLAAPLSVLAEAKDEATTLDSVQVQAGVAAPSTTTRLPISLQQTPQSISAIGLERLENESLFSLDDAMRKFTGVNVSFLFTGRPQYFARGFAITDLQVDGLPTFSDATNHEYDTAFYDRIEVIRGANGLLTGAGVPSATVNLLRKRPGKQFGASAAASVGRWDFSRVQADVDLPLSGDGRWRSRVVAAYQDRDYYYDRYSENKLAAMAVLEGDLGERTTLTLGHQTQDNNPVGSTWGTVPFFDRQGRFAHLPRSLSLAPKWARWTRESSTTYVQAETRFGEDWTLRLNTARTRGNAESIRVFGSGFPDAIDGSGVVLRDAYARTEDSRDNADLSLSGRFGAPGREHALAVGASWQQFDSRTPAFAASYPADWSRCAGNRACYPIADVHHWDGDIGQPRMTATGARRDQRTVQRGVYASTRLRLSEPLALIAGARLSSWETRTRAYDTRGAYAGTSGAYRVDDELTPYLGLMYELGPRVSLYASYTEIFNPQDRKDRNENLLEPVQGSNLEAGLKSQWLDGRLTANAAVFQAKQDNFALRDMSVPEGSLSDGSSAYVGVDGTQARGWEIDIDGEILPGWTINAGYTRVNVARVATDALFANPPKDYLQLNTQVRLRGALERLSLGAGVQWQGRVQGRNLPHPLGGTTTVSQPAYALVQLNAHYRIAPDWSLALSVRNALDKRYWANLDYNNYGEPRFAVLSLRWKY